MERWAGRVALVTGAAAGIGAAVGKALARHGMRVVGCDINLEKLQEVAQSVEGPGSFLAVQCDVSNEEAVLQLFKRIKDEYKGVDVIVNNAGVGRPAPLLAGDAQTWRHMLDVNILGMCMCTREAVKSMRDRKIDDGHVINMCSMSGQRIIKNANLHFYYATKFAIRALTEGVRNELREIKSRIRITEISPGLVKTEFQKKAMGEKEAEKFYSSEPILEPEDIAESIIYALSAPPHVQVHDILVRPTEQVY